MSYPHDCKISKCQGKKFMGLFINCCVCTNITYLECYEKYREMDVIFKGFGIKEMRTSVDAAVIQSQFDVLFAKKSPISSICETCLFSSTFVKRDILSSLESKIKKQRNEISELTAKLAVFKNDKENSVSHSADFDDSSSDVITPGLLFRFNTLKDSMTKSMESYGIEIANAIGKISEDISKTIQKTVQDEFGKQYQRNNANLITNSPVASNSDTNVNGTNVRVIEKIVIKPINGVYTIHVSKFPKGTKADDIVSLIIGKTDISSDSFSVEFSSNRKFKKNKFINFKISTLKKEICDKLVDNSIWSPNYTVKPFELKENLDIIKKKKKNNNSGINNNVKETVRKDSSKVHSHVAVSSHQQRNYNLQNKQKNQNSTKNNNHLRDDHRNNQNNFNYKNRFNQNGYSRRSQNVIPQDDHYPFWRMEFDQPPPLHQQPYYRHNPFQMNNVNSAPFVPTANFPMMYQHRY